MCSVGCISGAKQSGATLVFLIALATASLPLLEAAQLPASWATHSVRAPRIVIKMPLPPGLDGTGLRDRQYAVEAFYRIQFTDELQITPNVQLFWDPILNASDDFIAVFGVRAPGILTDQSMGFHSARRRHPS